MIVVLAFMAWVSAAKPWGRTRAAGRATAPAPHAAWFAMAVAVPFLDTAAVLTGVLPGPLLSIVSLIGYAAYRRARSAPPGIQPATPAPPRSLRGGRKDMYAGGQPAQRAPAARVLVAGRLAALTREC